MLVKRRESSRPCEMVIIVLRYEEAEVDDSHRCLQPRVKRCPGNVLGIEGIESLHQIEPRSSKAGGKIFRSGFVVIRLVSLSVGQVGRSKRLFSCEEIRETPEPERLQIQKMAYVLEDGPAFSNSALRQVRRYLSKLLLDP